MTQARLGLGARVLLALRLAPWTIRLPISYENAVAEVLRNDLAAARKRLLHILSVTPAPLIDVVPVKLLLARVLLLSGEPAAAAALFPEAFRALAKPKLCYLNDTERKYLRYVGNQAFELATRQLGRPSSFDIDVTFEELDIAMIRERLRLTFPLCEEADRQPEVARQAARSQTVLH